MPMSSDQYDLLPDKHGVLCQTGIALFRLSRAKSTNNVDVDLSNDS